MLGSVKILSINRYAIAKMKRCRLGLAYGNSATVSLPWGSTYLGGAWGGLWAQSVCRGYDSGFWD